MKSSNNILLSATSLNGTPIENHQGEHIGEILDLMIDTQTAKVAYAVVSVASGFFNLGTKYFAIPLEAFVVNTMDKKLLLDISKERLAIAPGFDKDNWPSGAQDEFINGVYGYYNLNRRPAHANKVPSQSFNEDQSFYGRTEEKQVVHNPIEQSVARDRKITKEANSGTGGIASQNPYDAPKRNFEGTKGSRDNLKYGYQDKLNNDPKHDETLRDNEQYGFKGRGAIERFE